MRLRIMDEIHREAAFDGHEEAYAVEDPDTGLTAFIAIHDTRLGPALGGCRMWPYQTRRAALVDALRLSRAMTSKNALAGLSHGGGKSVIIGDARRDRTPGLLRGFARAIDALGGRYITAEDVGIGVADLEVMRKETRHVRCIAEGGVGNPSPHTAHGVFRGIEATAMAALGSDDLEGVGVAILGLGSVGMALAERLYRARARLVVADIREDAVAHAVDRFRAEAVPADRAHAADVDIFSPCALGAVLNRRTIPEIRARAVAGAANNQLETPEDGRRLMERGILYAPDYAINAGGVIAISHEGPRFDRAALEADLVNIGATLARIFARSRTEGIPTAEVAAAMVSERLDAEPALACAASAGV